MTAFDFPLARQNLADLMMIETVTWHLRTFQELAGLGGGEWLARDLAPAVWEADCSTVAADLDTIEALYGRFNVLGDAIESFYLFNPARPYPASDPGGRRLAGAHITIGTIAINRKELTLAGVPAGLALGTGTMLSITAGASPRTALLQSAAPVTGVGAGATALVEVRPHMRPWLTAGQPVELIKPVAKVKLVPNSLAKSQASSVTWRLRFTARQTLAAG